MTHGSDSTNSARPAAERSFRSPTGAARRGRPLDEGLTGRLLSGALTLVAERGTDRFTADALSIATGAGKAAIYRRWSDAQALLVDAVGTCRTVPDPADTGSVGDDLITLLEPWTRGLTRDERALAAVLGQARRNPDLRTALLNTVVAPLTAAVAAIVGRHSARGHRVPDGNQALLCHLVISLWWERFITLRDPSPQATVEVIVDEVLLPLVPD